MAKRKGRPEEYSEEIADYICEQIAVGKSIRTICVDDNMPAVSTVYRWRRQHPDFSEQYAKAQEDRADYHVEEMFSIADADEGDVNRAKLQVDVRKWAAARMRPNSWGDKQQHEHSGPEGMPISHNVEVTFVRPEDQG